MDRQDIPFLSVAELSRLIETKEVSPVEAVQAYLERIDQIDGKLNSYITVCREEALQAAREAESAIAGGRYLGPLHGIPLAVKDQFTPRASAPPPAPIFFGTLCPMKTPRWWLNSKMPGQSF